jgi:hypothetical protein
VERRPVQIGHHILCAGPHTVPFARMCAECLVRSCPEAERDSLRIYVHVDGLRPKEIDGACRWLSEVPRTIPRWARFGIKPKETIPGRWHQRMVNRIVNDFAWEPLICFVDADFFLADDSWWQMSLDFQKDSLFAISHGLRANRQMVFGSQVYSAMKTQFFVLWPAEFLSVNSQGFTRDEDSLESLASEFPQAQLRMDKGIDSMVVGSLRAQALGWKVRDIEPGMNACHVGGFSHIKPEKFNSQKLEIRERWARRVRLMESVYAFMEELGWADFFDPGNMKQLRETRAHVARHEVLEQMIRTLAPTRNELAFEDVRRLFAN